MKTKLIKIENLNDDYLTGALEAPVNALKSGQVVCFPTETVYGIGAVWNDNDAVAEIFNIKNRPQDNPLIVHVNSVEVMKGYFSFWDEVADVLARSFCPGPFTLIMPKSEDISSPVTAGLDTIGVRIPSNKIANKLIELLGTGIAAPSANISGRPSPTNAQDAYEDLNGKLEYIIDGGKSDVGVESTIVSWDGKKLRLLRPGGVSLEDISTVLENNRIYIDIDTSAIEDLHNQEVALAPGMKYKHYAPKATVDIIYGKSIKEKIEYFTDSLSSSRKIGLYISSELHSELLANNLIKPDMEVIVFSDSNKHEEAANGLFEAFREFDRLACDNIQAEELVEVEIGTAYMNRLRKAAIK